MGAKERNTSEIFDFASKIRKIENNKRSIYPEIVFTKKRNTTIENTSTILTRGSNLHNKESEKLYCPKKLLFLKVCSSF